jgi:hypothetical protein
MAEDAWIAQAYVEELAKYFVGVSLEKAKRISAAEVGQALLHQSRRVNSIPLSSSLVMSAAP